MEHLWLREAEVGYEAPNNKHDKGYKYLLSVKKVFVELLRSFVKQDWVSCIDENNVVKVDKSFILPDFKNKEADLVYWVKIGGRDNGIQSRAYVKRRTLKEQRRGED